MKKRFLLSAALVLSMCACSSPSANTETPEEKPAETTAEETKQQETTLDSGQVIDTILAEFDLKISQIDDIYIPVADEENNFKVTFTINGEEYFCKINGTTGEIVEHNIPDDVLKTAQSAQDPFEAAINASFNELEGYSGGAEDIKVSQSGPALYTVEFNWNGEHYTFNYDANEGVITD